MKSAKSEISMLLLILGKNIEKIWYFFEWLHISRMGDCVGLRIQELQQFI